MMMKKLFCPEELLDAIATQDYGVSDDRSSKLTAPALRAYNKALKSEYGHYELRRGRTLPEGFTIVKVMLVHVHTFPFTFTPLHSRSHLIGRKAECPSR